MKDLRINFPKLRILILSLFFIMQVYLIFIKKHDTLDLDIAPNRVPSVNITGDIYLSQSFIVRTNNLSRIDVMMGTHDRINDKLVYFELRDSQDSDPLIQVEFNAREIMNNLYNRFDFPPIKDSKGRSFRLSFRSPDSTQDNAICLWINDQDIYSEGEFFIKEDAAQGEVIFRTYSRRPIITELHRIVRNYEGIFSSVAFLLFAIILFEIAQFLMLWWLLGFIHRSWTDS